LELPTHAKVIISSTLHYETFSCRYESNTHMLMTSSKRLHFLLTRIGNTLNIPPKLISYVLNS
jgi:hypothetical protein